MKYQITVASYGEVGATYEAQNYGGACQFVASYMTDEFDEQGERDIPLTREALRAGVDQLMAGMTSGEDFCFMFDGEAVIVQKVPT